MAKWLYEIKGWGKVIESEDKFAVRRDKLVALLRESDWFKAEKDEDTQEELEWAIVPVVPTRPTMMRSTASTTRPTSNGSGSPRSDRRNKFP